MYTYHQYQLREVFAHLEHDERLKLFSGYANRYKYLYAVNFQSEYKPLEIMMKDCVDDKDEIKCNNHVQPAFEVAVRSRFTDHDPENDVNLQMILNTLFVIGRMKNDE